MARRRMREDFVEARSRMRDARPIAPVDDHFATSSLDYQEAVGCATFASFFKSWRALRRDHRAQRSAARR